MKKLEILRKLLDCNTETQNKQTLLEKWHPENSQCRVAKNLQFVKNTKSIKCKKGKWESKGNEGFSLVDP